LRFYNSLTRRREIFTPIDASCVRIYVCGPTVYDYAHIGNARPVIVFDLLYRLLRHIYGADKVRYARNITDVDDKINARAARDYPELPLNEAIACVTEATYAQFQADTDSLACLRPDFEPRATDHIAEMRALIERLVERGHAYVAENHVLFSVASMGKKLVSGSAHDGLPAYDSPPYGSLSRRSLDDMLAGARVDVAAYKRDEMDFVLWKPSKSDEPGWPSPARIEVKGRPGWHIECSAMSMAKLLAPYGGGLHCDDPNANIFDIHCGGIDLIFPHHENEIAQSCCALGTQKMANFWLHNGFLQVEGQKMSKSLGNFITIAQVLSTDLPRFHEGVDADSRTSWCGLAARFSMLQTHYREPINWTQKRLIEASDELFRWYQLLRAENIKAHQCDIDEEFVAALADDLNSWQAITLLRRFYKAREVQKLASGLQIIGLLREDFITQSAHPLFVRHVALDEAIIKQWVDERLTAIAQKNWAQADAIRQRLNNEGIILTDKKHPVTGERVTQWEVK